MRPRPRQCDAASHRTGCRKDRPLCRWRRRAYAKLKFNSAGPCDCDAYHYPHRPGSGDCSRRSGALGMPSLLRKCPHCRREHRDHSWCA